MYRLYTALFRGTQHPLCCEDAFIAEALSDDVFIAAVCDGCSSGKDSHFAAVLQCKLLRKIIYNSTDFPPLSSAPDTIGYWLLQNFMEQLAEAKMTLYLSNEELLATLIVLIRCGDAAWVSVLGDGVININGTIQEIDQNNTPDYPAYHFTESDEEWARYFKKQSFMTNQLRQIAIATDGVLSFVGGGNGMSHQETAEYLLTNNDFMQQKGMLYRKYNLLQNQYRLLATDDIAIVRLDKTID